MGKRRGDCEFMNVVKNQSKLLDQLKKERGFQDTVKVIPKPSHSITLKRKKKQKQSEFVIKSKMETKRSLSANSDLSKKKKEKTSKKGKIPKQKISQITSPEIKYVRKSKKIYNETNVLDATFARLRLLFTEFDNISFAISGGKDSGVTLQLANMVAAEMGKKFSVMFIDFEAMYMETARFVESLREEVKPNCENFYWICLPFCEDNATSALNPEFITWDESAREHWVRDIPEGAITWDNNPFPFAENINDFDRFIFQYSQWLHKTKKAKRTAIVVGIRTDESLRRFLAVANRDKPRYKGLFWTTEILPNIYNAYPIYDWKVEDIWGCVAKFNLDYNHVYEDMYKNGVPLSLQRICQPFGSAQKAGLDQYRVIEPETWERLLQRVEGVNFGAIYCRTSLLGNLTSMKPDHLTWQQYTIFLLESIGIYEPLIMRRYYEKIKYYMLWCEKNLGIPYGKMPDAGKGKSVSWQTVARAIEKNDFYMTYLDFGYDKAGDELLIKLREKHRLTGDGHIQRKLRKRIEAIECGKKKED